MVTGASHLACHLYLRVVTHYLALGDRWMVTGACVSRWGVLNSYCLIISECEYRGCVLDVELLRCTTTGPRCTLCC